jgi:FkbM family methyltransferase
MKLVNYVKNKFHNSTKRLRQRRNLAQKARQKDYLISYAQSGEDIIIEFVFNNILKQEHFNYCDVGAHHSTYISNTALFYRKGMTGICIEPDPELFAEIKQNRPKDICLNYGIGFSDDIMAEEALDFFVMSSRSLNTFSRQEAERLHKQGEFTILDTKKIKTVNINKVFKQYFTPDFLSIDVEGLDVEIIKSIDLVNHRPKVICVETAEFSPIPPGIKIYDAIDYLKTKDYIFYADTYSNSIFIDNLYLKKIYS